MTTDTINYKLILLIFLYCLKITHSFQSIQYCLGKVKYFVLTMRILTENAKSCKRQIHTLSLTHTLHTHTYRGSACPPTPQKIKTNIFWHKPLVRQVYWGQQLHADVAPSHLQYFQTRLAAIKKQFSGWHQAPSVMSTTCIFKNLQQGLQK